MNARSTYLTLLLTLIVSLTCSARSIKGRVIDDRQLPVDYATVALMGNDSNIVASTICDREGAFALTCDPDKAMSLRVTAIGYATTYVPYTETDTTITIVLQATGFTLQEVTIDASRIERTPGGYNINLQGDKLREGKAAQSLIAMLPGMNVSDDGIQAYNIAITDIYINGTRINSREELGQLPAEYLTQIQVDLVPTGRDSGSKGGVMYITMEQPTQNGCYGNVTVGAAALPYYDGFIAGNLSSMIQAKVGKVSFYNYLLSADQDNNYDTRDRRQNNIDNSTLTTTTEGRSTAYNLYDRLSVTYEINDAHTLGVGLGATLTKQKPHYVTYNETYVPQSLIDGLTNDTEWQATVQYNAKLNEKGANFTFTGDYLQRDNFYDNSYSYYDEDVTPVLATAEQVGRTSQLWQANAQLRYPFSSKVSLTTGLAFTHVSSRYNLEGKGVDDRWTTNSVEHSIMNGYTPLFNASVAGRLGQWQYGAGIAVQYHHMTYSASDRSVANTNTQWGILPHISVMYPFDTKHGHAFNLMYRRLMDNIPYDAISPFITYEDAYNYTKGNPDLKAPTTDFVMAGISLFQNRLNISANFSRASNQIVYATMQDAANPRVSYTMPINVKGTTGGGLEIETNLKPTRWWTTKLMGRILVVGENGLLNNVQYNETHMRYFALCNNNFSFTSTFGGTLNASVEPTFKTYDRTYKTVFQLRMSLYKYFLHRTILLSLNANIYQLNRQMITSTPLMNIHWSNITHNACMCNIRFTWFFNAGKKDIDVKTTEHIQSFREIKDAR